MIEYKVGTTYYLDCAISENVISSEQWDKFWGVVFSLLLRMSLLIYRLGIKLEAILYLNITYQTNLRKIY